jgi:RNA polymerase sigma-70 factor (ECF subfamily)
MDDRRRRFEAQALPHIDAAYNLARWLARSNSDADDIVQEAMLRAFRAFDSVRGDIRPWLLAIVRNCWHSWVSDARRRGHTPLPTGEGNRAGVELKANEPDPEDTVISIDQGRKLNDVIARLPADLREVLVLRELEDLSYRDIAQITGAPIGTVMSRLSRARAQVRTNWIDRTERSIRHGSS